MCIIDRYAKRNKKTTTKNKKNYEFKCLGIQVYTCIQVSVHSLRGNLKAKNSEG